jgi:dihydroorotate dehydrogenase electron transfer subunit
MGSEVPFPFELVESRLEVAGVRKPATHAVALLEQWGVPSRLASNAGITGAHRGYITDLARTALQAMSAAERAETQVFACGPTPMLKAAAKLARDFDLPCQVALEEYMACGIGGCAGCTVLLQTPDGPAMKRVCVDGPVFDARHVY